MKIFSELNENKNLAIALGYFDGVHKGHQAVISNAVYFAKENSVKSAVITFKDHPCCYFWNISPKYILTREERRRQIEKLGVDYLYEIDFKQVAKLSAQDYIENVLVKYFSPCAISTGFNHNFGLNKSGNKKFLQDMSKKYDYIYFVTEPVKYSGEIISSTAIREALTAGSIEKANQMLGYNFSIEGIVVEGQKLGRKIGFRTANIIYPAELIDIPFGAYKTIAKVGKKTYNAVTNFGIRPTVTTSNLQVIETHILDFDKDIYGENIRVEFLELIRKEQKFKEINDLKKQIQKDIIYCRS